MTNEDGKHNVGEDKNSTSRKYMARTKSGLLRGRPHTMPAWELYSLGLIYILCIGCDRKLLQIDLSGLHSCQNHAWVTAGLTFASLTNWCVADVHTAQLYVFVQVLNMLFGINTKVICSHLEPRAKHDSRGMTLTKGHSRHKHNILNTELKCHELERYFQVA